MNRIVVLTGAGISAESGIKTFRDSDGLWEEYKIEEVATYDAWCRNRELVIEFYNQRRKQLFDVQPNAAHYALVKLEEKYNVQIITQNVDDLHERSGSTDVIHLHGELKKVRSTVDDKLVYELNGWELKVGDLCEKGSQLRPHIVWFGEMVPEMNKATRIAEKADIFIIIGTSLNVYPAAGLINYVPQKTHVFLIDTNSKDLRRNNLTIIKEKASLAVPLLIKQLMN